MELVCSYLLSSYSSRDSTISIDFPRRRDNVPASIDIDVMSSGNGWDVLFKGLSQIDSPHRIAPHFILLGSISELCGHKDRL